jgi:hypothetical protein
MVTTRADSSRPLPRSIVIPGVMTIATLADVLELVEKRLPKHYRQETPWRHVAAELKAVGKNGNTADVSTALQMALSLSGVDFQVVQRGRQGHLDRRDRLRIPRLLMSRVIANILHNDEAAKRKNKSRGSRSQHRDARKRGAPISSSSHALPGANFREDDLS